MKGEDVAKTVVAPESIVKLVRDYCFCGRPDEVWQLIIDELERCEKPHENRTEKDWISTPHGWLLGYVVEHSGATTHGGNVSGSWLEPEGVLALAFLRSYGADWMDDEGINFVNSDGANIGGTWPQSEPIVTALKEGGISLGQKLREMAEQARRHNGESL